MGKDFYQFQLGDFKCTIVNDWRGVTMFPSVRASLSNATEEEFVAVIRAHGYEPDGRRVEVFVNCLLVDTGEQRILFDVGMGTPDLFAGTGKVRPDLISAGYLPEDIDIVILTHGHWDHVAGLTDDAGDFLFPNATYMMQRDEWAFWNDPANMRFMHPNYAKYDPISFDKLPLISERMSLFAPEGEFLPGISAIPAPGHTPGHTVFSLKSGNQQLLHISDLVHHVLHFEYPDFHHEVDVEPERSVASRRKILKLAAAEKLLVLGSHTGPGPGLGLGYVRLNGKAWKWYPLASDKI
ncbi:MAG: MBL fold metallo-hydrolase [Anaerolineae bacterium]